MRPGHRWKRQPGHLNNKPSSVWPVVNTLTREDLVRFLLETAQGSRACAHWVPSEAEVGDEYLAAAQAIAGGADVNDTIGKHAHVAIELAWLAGECDANGTPLPRERRGDPVAGTHEAPPDRTVPKRRRTPSLATQIKRAEKSGREVTSVTLPDGTRLHSARASRPRIPISTIGLRNMRIRLKGINSITKRLADGSQRTYWYAWKGGPPLRGGPGSAQFVASYNEAARSATTSERSKSSKRNSATFRSPHWPIGALAASSWRGVIVSRPPIASTRFGRVTTKPR